MGMENDSTVMLREEPKVDEARRQRVHDLCKMVREDIERWDYAFKRMKNWRRFTRGLQWPGSKYEDLSDPDRQYVANITLRHLKQRTASIYAKNPSYKWRPTRRIKYQFWDGSAAQLQMAQQMVASGADLTGMYTAILQEVSEVESQDKIISKMGETLTGLYEYFIKEQTPPAKKMMKKQVLAALTDGVAYFKQTFQRATDYSPEVRRALEDHRSMLAKLERLSADMADDEFDENDAQADELRTLIEHLEGQDQIILREGLVIDYPDATNIIPDQNMTWLPGFIGCNHVTEQFCLTPNQIKEVYGVDVTKSFTEYTTNDGSDGNKSSTTARVWEIWDKVDGTVCTVCDGYPDYLVEPAAPPVYTERFWPWFMYAPNAIEDSDDPFPPSDVELMMPMQMEINRAGQGLADHRYAARPGHVTGSNIPDEDAEKISNRKAHDVVVLKSMKPDQRVQDVFQEFPTSPIDPNLYNTGPAFSDILRAVGTQEANLGGTGGATATESSIAESSRLSTVESAIDELDDLLTEMARAGGQILLLEMSRGQVIEIMGPAAVWPVESKEDVAREIHLEVMAGSSGRKNRAQEVQVRERVLPLLFQLPGLSAEEMTRDLVRVMDDTINYEDWVDKTALPVVALNGQLQASANRGTMDGEGDNGQGGANNAMTPPEPSSEGPPRQGQDMPGAQPRLGVV